MHIGLKGSFTLSLAGFKILTNTVLRFIQYTWVNLGPSRAVLFFSSFWWEQNQTARPQMIMQDVTTNMRGPSFVDINSKWV